MNHHFSGYQQVVQTISWRVMKQNISKEGLVKNVNTQKVLTVRTRGFCSFQLFVSLLGTIMNCPGML